ncbi:MAG: hypothetical protein DMG05_26480 [Acidobacteria bacterium]|nr:MAG: hypothetical protein DMG05_26480 [Acidobacteriota bacterium]
MVSRVSRQKLASYLERNENFVLVSGIVVVLDVVVVRISRTSLRTTTSTMCWDIKGDARG